MSIDIAALAPLLTQAVVGVGGSRHRSGSGTVIAPGTVVTTAHNLRGRRPGHDGGSTEITVTFGGGRTATGTVKAASEDLDLAVIAVDTGDLTTLTHSDAGVVTGQEILALAAPGGIARITAGTVATHDSRLRTRTGSPVDGVFEHTAPLVPGASGGPVTDATGALVGLDTNRLDGGLYQAVATTAAVRALIDGLAGGEVPAPRRLGVTVARSQEAAHLRESVGLPPLEGVLVTGVEADGPAASAGLGRGDLIMAVDGTPLRRPDDLLLAVRRGGATVALSVVRGADAPRDVTVTPTAA